LRDKSIVAPLFHKPQVPPTCKELVVRGVIEEALEIFNVPPTKDKLDEVAFKPMIEVASSILLMLLLLTSKV
jgi:hypothetical protein